MSEHMVYVLVAYLTALVLVGGMVIDTLVRWRRARRLLAELDSRRGRRPARAPAAHEAKGEALS